MRWKLTGDFGGKSTDFRLKAKIPYIDCVNALFLFCLPDTRKFDTDISIVGRSGISRWTVLDGHMTLVRYSARNKPI